MNLFQTIFLGLVEGVTEFLPVSSTAHLLLVQRFFGITSPSLFFDVIVQLGAIAAVVVYFHKKLWRLSVEAVMYVQDLAAGKITVTPENLPIGLSLLVATLPIFFIGFILRKKIAVIHESMLIIAIMSIAVGLFLAWAQTRARKEAKVITSRNILVMGLYQVLALIPGTSRSGISVAGGLFDGMTFSQALEYSFLLGVPALTGAGIFELLSALKDGVDSAIVVPTLIATLIAFVSALVVIHFLLKFVKKVGFMPFVIYRILFGIVAFMFR